MMERIMKLSSFGLIAVLSLALVGQLYAQKKAPASGESPSITKLIRLSPLTKPLLRISIGTM